MKYCIGIDVGGTTIKTGIFEAEGRLLKKWEIPTRKGDGGTQFLKDAAASIREALQELSIPMEDVLGAGMGVPGPVVANGYVEVCVNLGLHKCYPAKLLSEELSGMKVVLGNDANVAALGEMWQGAGKGHGSLCMVTLGTGVGGGIVCEGKIIPGVHGSGGEIGHVRVEDGEPEPCNCGGHGCLEQYASATGIVTSYKMECAARGVEPVELTGTSDSRSVFEAAKNGDEAAWAAIDTMCDYLGRALALISSVVDPEAFVLGGGTSNSSDMFMDRLVERYKSYALAVCTETPIEVASLGNDAGIFGAAYVALQAAGK